MGYSKIAWTEKTWNPTTGCEKVSAGCKHCYAEREWPRFRHLPAFAGRAFTDVACHPARLVQPLQWKKPCRVFVDAMSDLFHPDVPEAFIDRVFAVMALSHHTFQLLTKRALRMRDYLAGLARDIPRLDRAARELGWALEFDGRRLFDFPLRNLWLGVTAEDQAAADERIPLLLQTPASVRWLSAEPLLGPINLEDAFGSRPSLDWVVAGAESGPRARPMDLAWARGLRDQCREAKAAFFMKQICEKGRKLEMGRWPEDLRTQDYPRIEYDAPVRRGD